MKKVLLIGSIGLLLCLTACSEVLEAAEQSYEEQVGAYEVQAYASDYIDIFEELVDASDYIVRVLLHGMCDEFVALIVTEQLKGDSERFIYLQRDQSAYGLDFFESGHNLVFLRRTDAGVVLVNERHSVFRPGWYDYDVVFKSTHENGASHIIQFSKLSALARQRFEESISHSPRLEVNVRRTRTITNLNPSPEHPHYPVVIRNVDELAAYKSHYDGIRMFYAGVRQYMNDVIFSEYTEEFFQENVLIILHHILPDGASFVRVDAVLENGDIHVSESRHVALPGTMAIVGWHVFIEICQSMAPDSFNLHTQRGIWFSRS